MEVTGDDLAWQAIAGIIPLSLAVLVTAWSAYEWWKKNSYYGANRGPKVYPLVGSQPEFLRNVYRVYDWATDYLKMYPNHTFRLVRPLAGNIITTAHPTNVEYILKTNFANYPKGDQVQHAFKDLLGNGIFNADGAAWKSQRKVASFEFSTRTLRDFLIEILLEETRDRLMPFLWKACGEGNIIDLQDVFMRFAFDTICLLGFGVDAGCLDLSLPEVEFAKSFDEATRITIKRFYVPSPVWKIKNALGVGDAKEMKAAVEVIDKFAYSVIQSRRSELSSDSGRDCGKSKFSKGHSDLLSRFIQLADKEAREELSRRNSTKTSSKTDLSAEVQALSDVYIRDILINFVLAGRDTSSAALTWFFWLLSKHPEVEEKICAEIQAIAKNKRFKADEGLSELKVNDMHNLVNHSSLEFDYDDLREMHYLNGALSETLRLYPPVANDSKTALADDVLPDGTVIHRGDRVVFHPYAMGRLESLWGADCLEFKPERWLKDGVYVPESSFKFAVFQAGPRICLGKEMAMTQMKCIAAAIISSPLRIKVAPGQTFNYEISLTLKMKDGLLVTVDTA